MTIDERKVDEAFERFKTAINLALQMDVQHLEALIERVRIDLIVNRIDRDRRHIYRGFIDLVETTLERRYEQGSHDRETIREHVMAYFRRMLHELGESERER